VPGRRREAHAESGIASVRLADGLVEFRGLHWDATQHTGEAPVAAGGFHLDEVIVGGALLPLPGGDGGLTGALPRLQEVMAPLGVSIELPALIPRSDGGTEVTPLRIRTGGETRLSGPAGQLLGAPQPARDAIAGAVKGDAQNCNDPRGAAAGPLFGAGLLLSDITLAAVTGTGGLDIELGGAQAMTEGNVYDDPFGNRRPFPLPPVRPAPPPAKSSAASEPPWEAPVPEPPATALAMAAPDPAPALDAPPVSAMPVAGTVVRQRSSTRCATAHPFGRPACSKGAASLAGAASLGVALALFAGDALVARRRRHPEVDA
jgi:hypothetical protein